MGKILEMKDDDTVKNFLIAKNAESNVPTYTPFHLNLIDMHWLRLYLQPQLVALPWSDVDITFRVAATVF